MKSHTYSRGHGSRAFTVVEILIVIVVIAILATIITVSYRAVVGRAGTTAIQTELKDISEKMKLQGFKSGVYPSSFSEVGVSVSGDKSVDYKTSHDRKKYCVSIAEGDVMMRITSESSAPADGACEDFPPAPEPEVPTFEVLAIDCSYESSYFSTLPDCENSFDVRASGKGRPGATIIAGLCYSEAPVGSSCVAKYNSTDPYKSQAYTTVNSNGNWSLSLELIPLTGGINLLTGATTSGGTWCNSYGAPCDIHILQFDSSVWPATDLNQNSGTSIHPIEVLT